MFSSSFIAIYFFFFSKIYLFQFQDDFDEDDPLAGLLSDDDDIPAAKPSLVKKSLATNSAVSTPSENSGTAVYALVGITVCF